jgi:hypothetical protein
MRTLPPTTATFPETGTPSLAQRIASALLLFVATSVATRFAFLNARFLNIDEAAHLLGARALVHGDRLYVDFADNKPPLVYAFYALAQWTLGPGLDSVRWFGALVLIPAIALAALAYFRFERAGVAAGLAFVVASSTLFASDGQVVHCEHVMLLPLAWSLVITRAPGFFSRTRLLLAVGALVGLATLGKQPAALSLVAYGVGVLLCAPGALAKARGLVALALGFAAPWALVLLVFAQQQSATDAVFWIWQYNAGHMDNPMSNLERIERLAWYGAALLPAMLPLLAAWGWGWKAHRGERTDARMWGLFAVATLVPGFLGLRMFGHYFVPGIFALSLAAGPFLGRLHLDRRHLAIASFAVLALLIETAISLFVHHPGSHIADVNRPAYANIGSSVRAHASERDRGLFVRGYAPMIYVFANARPASRFVVPIDTLSGYLADNDAVLEGRLDTASRINDAHRRALLEDLRVSRPRHIVDTAPGDLNHWGRFGLTHFPGLQALIARDYVRQSVVDGAVIYVRRDEQLAAHVDAPRHQLALAFESLFELGSSQALAATTRRLARWQR